MRELRVKDPPNRHAHSPVIREFTHNKPLPPPPTKNPPHGASFGSYGPSIILTHLQTPTTVPSTCESSHHHLTPFELSSSTPRNIHGDISITPATTKSSQLTRNLKLLQRVLRPRLPSYRRPSSKKTSSKRLVTPCRQHFKRLQGTRLSFKRNTPSRSNQLISIVGRKHLNDVLIRGGPSLSQNLLQTKFKKIMAPQPLERKDFMKLTKKLYENEACKSYPTFNLWNHRCHEPVNLHDETGNNEPTILGLTAFAQPDHWKDFFDLRNKCPDDSKGIVSSPIISDNEIVLPALVKSGCKKPLSDNSNIDATALSSLPDTSCRPPSKYRARNEAFNNFDSSDLKTLLPRTHGSSVKTSEVESTTDATNLEMLLHRNYKASFISKVDNADKFANISKLPNRVEELIAADNRRAITSKDHGDQDALSGKYLTQRKQLNPILSQVGYSIHQKLTSAREERSSDWFYTDYGPIGQQEPAPAREESAPIWPSTCIENINIQYPIQVEGARRDDFDSRHTRNKCALVVAGVADQVQSDAVPGSDIYGEEHIPQSALPLSEKRNLGQFYDNLDPIALGGLALPIIRTRRSRSSLCVEQGPEAFRDNAWDCLVHTEYSGIKSDIQCCHDHQEHSACGQLQTKVQLASMGPRIYPLLADNVPNPENIEIREREIGSEPRMKIVESHGLVPEIPGPQNENLAQAEPGNEYQSGHEVDIRVKEEFRQLPSRVPIPIRKPTNPLGLLDKIDEVVEDEGDVTLKVPGTHGRFSHDEVFGPIIYPTTPESRSSSSTFISITTTPSSFDHATLLSLEGVLKCGQRLPEIPLTEAVFETFPPMETRLAVRTEAKTKAVEDARKMQAYVVEECKKSGKDPPPFGLEELIGKGSFGRVYKGKDMTTAKVVAIKIIDIDESDTLDPKHSDTYSEFLKEVNALKLLGENKAKNINLVLEALPVGKAMWMITEYCGGGSVATLMKPTAPRGLLEKWVKIITREVAEGLYWVHQVGIIHRDIKCANVLVTENGDVQLCDFGVAGMIENKTDKRTTIIGTPHWMAPELLVEHRTAVYGKEVDIWAFGAMIYEMASGLPPSAAAGISIDRLYTYLKQNLPRLEGPSYSDELRDLVACCLQVKPEARPAIEDLQKHPFIYNTSTNYPISSLRALVLAFRKWETDGGTRKSLFWQHGAQAPSAIASPRGDDEWVFSVTDNFDDKLQNDFQEMANAYKFPADDASRTARPAQQASRPSRRRPPPEALGRGLSVGPLEKLFDPNTLTSYNDNIVARYGKQSDLPLRDDSVDTSIKDTMIDLGGHDAETGISNFSDMDTIRASRRGQDEGSDLVSTLHDFSRPALSDPADINLNRRTQDWKFPSAAPPASADPEISRFPPTSYEIPRSTINPGSGDRLPLINHPAEPLGLFGGGLMTATAPPPLERQSTRESLIDLDMGRLSMRESLIDLDMGRLSLRESLIDLDMSLPDPIPEFRRPSTANSDVGSTTSEHMASANPFELERHPSLYMPIQNAREPSIYVSDNSLLPLPNGSTLNELGDMSDFSASDVEGGYSNDSHVPINLPYLNGNNSSNGFYDDRQGRSQGSQYNPAETDDQMPPPALPMQPHPLRTSSRMAMPSVSDPPSSRISTGMAPLSEVEAEMKRAIGGITAQLESFRAIYGSQEVLSRRGSGLKRERRDPPAPPAL